MNRQPAFKQGTPSEQVTTLLERIQFADLASPDIDEDNVGQSWGHYQFTAGGVSPSSSLTSWEVVGNVATAFKLVAAGLKTCQDVRTMCANAGTLQTTGFVGDIFSNKSSTSLRSAGPRPVEYVFNYSSEIWNLHFFRHFLLSAVQSFPPPPPHIARPQRHRCHLGHVWSSSHSSNRHPSPTFSLPLR